MFLPSLLLEGKNFVKNVPFFASEIWMRSPFSKFIEMLLVS
jgi:hypothetical protein